MEERTSLGLYQHDVSIFVEGEDQLTLLSCPGVGTGVVGTAVGRYTRTAGYKGEDSLGDIDAGGVVTALQPQAAAGRHVEEGAGSGHVLLDLRVGTGLESVQVHLHVPPRDGLGVEGGTSKRVSRCEIILCTRTGNSGQVVKVDLVGYGDALYDIV